MALPIWSGPRTHTGQAALTDYCFETLKLNLNEQLSGNNEEAFDYPGTYTEKDDGARYTGVRLEERQAAQSVVEGIGRCRAFTAGFTFTLQDHYRNILNQEYLLTSVKHEAFDNTYRQGQGEPGAGVGRTREVCRKIPEGAATRTEH